MMTLCIIYAFEVAVKLSIPHPIPYQGSKRLLAPAILSYMPKATSMRLVEPFAGSAAITLAAASSGIFSSYVIGDVLKPLMQLWQMIADNPHHIADKYEIYWHCERKNPIEAYYEIRSEFNTDGDPTKLLYLLVRCVKNAVRFNPSGGFNQSPDKRRTGRRPELMRTELFAANKIISGKLSTVSTDFMTLILNAKEDDFFYLDPPYQGTTDGRDKRYISGVSRDKVIESLTILNEKRIPFILSYDGSCGEHNYGEYLPSAVAHRIMLDTGRSSQATLNGRKDITIESLYISKFISQTKTFSASPVKYHTEQQTLFA